MQIQREWHSNEVNADAVSEVNADAVSDSSVEGPGPRSGVYVRPTLCSERSMVYRIEFATC